MLVMNLAVSDFLLMICLIPECIFNFFSGGPWRFGEMACLIHAFTGKINQINSVQTSSKMFERMIQLLGALCGYSL